MHKTFRFHFLLIIHVCINNFQSAQSIYNNEKDKHPIEILLKEVKANKLLTTEEIVNAQEKITEQIEEIQEYQNQLLTYNNCLQNFKDFMNFQKEDILLSLINDSQCIHTIIMIIAQKEQTHTEKKLNLEKKSEDSWLKNYLISFKLGGKNNYK